MTTTRSTFRTSDGVALAVCHYGPRDRTTDLTVVLAHCWTLNQDDWHYQVKALLNEFGHDISVITYDHRGHGDSSAVPKHQCTIDNLARDLGELIDAYAPTGTLVLGGHSIGGMTLMALAEQRLDIVDRVGGLALVSTSSGRLNQITLGLPEMGERMRAQIPRMLAFRSATLSRRARRRAPIVERLIMRRFVFGTPIRLADAALAVDGLINSPGASVVGFYEDFMIHERTAALKAYADVPTRILVGTRDVLTPPAHARRMREQLPDAELTVAPGAGHMLPLERDELVSGALIRLVREARGR